jgi:hypothetical protein
MQYTRETTFLLNLFSLFSNSVFHSQHLIWYQSQVESQTMENQNSTSNSALYEISDSLVLHNGDSPSSILVSQPLIGENYNLWNRSMTMALSAKNKICLIDGSMSKPSNSSPELKPWMRCNDMVLSWIINSVSKEIASSIIYIDNAEAMWKDLKERFSQGNGPRIFQLQKSIAAITFGKLLLYSS